MEVDGEWGRMQTYRRRGWSEKGNCGECLGGERRKRSRRKDAERWRERVCSGKEGRGDGQEKFARWKQGSGKEWEQRIEMGWTEEECWAERKGRQRIRVKRQK